MTNPLFQQRNGYVADGIVGPETLKALIETIKSTEPSVNNNQLYSVKI
ncbi:peptidoglycan-binding domain-containing protein [Peribacillus simplex]